MACSLALAAGQAPPQKPSIAVDLLISESFDESSNALFVLENKHNCLNPSSVGGQGGNELRRGNEVKNSVDRPLVKLEQEGGLAAPSGMDSGRTHIVLVSLGVA